MYCERKDWLKTKASKLENCSPDTVHQFVRFLPGNKLAHSPHSGKQNSQIHFTTTGCFFQKPNHQIDKKKVTKTNTFQSSCTLKSPNYILNAARFKVAECISFLNFQKYWSSNSILCHRRGVFYEQPSNFCLFLGIGSL